jgi:hypothetical protein
MLDQLRGSHEIILNELRGSAMARCGLGSVQYEFHPALLWFVILSSPRSSAFMRLTVQR